MKIDQYNDEIPYIIIDNFYENWECDLIWQELEFLNHNCKWDVATKENRESATKHGKILKTNKFQWLDTLYYERSKSNILTVNRKLFDKGTWKKIVMSHPHWFFNTFECLADSTLLSYYNEDGDGYLKHQDLSYMTCLTWFHKDPKKYTGGDFILFCGEKEIPVESNNNRMIIFPSRIPHQVTKLTMDDDAGKNDGRFCLTQFLFYSTSPN